MEQKGIGSEELFDCIVIGAGPGGLQACIHLGRYNFRVLLFHRPGGRTYHAKHIENYLGLRIVGGPELLDIGLAQRRADIAVRTVSACRYCCLVQSDQPCMDRQLQQRVWLQNRAIAGRRCERGRIPLGCLGRPRFR